MRELVIAGLLLAGCSEHGSPVPDADPLDQGPIDVTVHWRFVDHAGTPQACPDAGATVDLVVVFSRSPSTVVGTFPCSAGQASTVVDPPPRNSAGVAVSVHRGDGSLFAAPDPLPAVSDETITITTDRGRLAARYQFTRNGQPVHCVDLGFPLVRATFTPPGGPASSYEEGCINGSAIASDFLESGVPVTVDVVSANAGVSVANVIVPTGELLVDAPLLTLAVP